MSAFATYAFSIIMLVIYITFPPRSLKCFTEKKLGSLKITAQVAVGAGLGTEVQRSVKLPEEAQEGGKLTGKWAVK